MLSRDYPKRPYIRKQPNLSLQLKEHQARRVTPGGPLSLTQYQNLEIRKRSQRNQHPKLTHG